MKCDFLGSGRLPRAPAPDGFLRKPLQNVGILGCVVSLKSNGVRIIGKALGILGIPAGARAGAMGEFTKSLGNH